MASVVAYVARADASALRDTSAFVAYVAFTSVSTAYPLPVRASLVT